MEFSAADGACGCSETANRRADAYSEEISKQNCGYHHDGDERKSLTVQFVHAGVGSRLLHTAFRNHRPIQFRKGAVGADHFDGTFVLPPDETDCRSAAQVRG